MVTKVDQISDSVSGKPNKIMVRWLIMNPSGVSSMELNYNEYIVDESITKKVPDSVRDSEDMIVMEELMQYSTDLAHEFAEAMEPV
jgi:hypothetical protein